MLIIARNNVHEKLDNDDYNVAFLNPGQSYEVIGIEYGYFRVVLDNLDAAMVHPIYCDVQNYKNVNLWAQEINDKNFHFTPRKFNDYSYFFERFHDGDIECVNTYMHYLGTLFGVHSLKNTIYGLYLEAISNEKLIISYWLKQWMKSLFKVEKAINLRQFSKADWQQKLVEFFEP